jgi:hypothetical protein
MLAQYKRARLIAAQAITEHNESVIDRLPPVFLHYSIFKIVCEKKWGTNRGSPP